MQPFTLLLKIIPCIFLLLFTTFTAHAQLVRHAIELTDGWQFSMGGTQQQVTIPHSWNRVGYYDNGLMENRSDSVNKTMGVGVYTRILNIEPAQDKQIWLEFDGVSRLARVYINDTFIGKHDGPFTRFRFDITGALNRSGKNTLRVEVDNSKPEADSATGHTFPIAGDFFVAGGIYRSARVVITNKSHFAMQDFGSDGIYTRTEKVSTDKATISINALTEVSADSPVTDARFTLTDPNGKVIVEERTDLSSRTSEINTSLTIKKPVLWGVRSPYLYTLTANLENNGEILDSVSFPIGVRTAKATKDGFFVNGEKVVIKGVGYHQDNYVNGWASSYADTKRDFSLLMDMGINSIRLSHYPHGQAVHKLANEAGILLWDEIPVVTFWNYGGNNEAMADALKNNAIMQLHEMVKQNYNHPSVVIWGIANEVDFAKAAPAFIGATPEDIGSPIPLLETLNEEVKKLDSRQTAVANCCQHVASMKPLALLETMEVPDIVGANRYFGWYFGEVNDLSGNLDELHKLNKPIGVSEYGGGGAVSLHTDNTAGGKIDAAGYAQPEEYMSLIHEQSWPIISSKEWMMGAWIWNAFDFSTTIRKEGDTKDINTKGLITADRSILKDSYYFYQASWSEKPVVHITSKRYVERQYPVMDVKVYSNAPSTILSVNGKAVVGSGECEHFVCEWKNVRLSAGENTLIATGQFDGREKTDSATFEVSEDAARRFNINAGYIVSTETFGSDHFFHDGVPDGMDVTASWRNKAKRADIQSNLPHEVVAHYRKGDFYYQIPVAQGKYDITFVLVEPELAATAGSRVFNISINGNQIFSEVDIVKATGKGHREYQLSSHATSDGEPLVLNFTPVKGEAVVSAIIIAPSE